MQNTNNLFTKDIGTYSSQSQGELSSKTPNITPYSDDEKIEPKTNTVKEVDTTDVDVDKLVNLKMKLKTKTLKSSSFIDRTFPMLTTLSVDKPEGTHRAPVDLVCVIDHSGSMYGEKIELLKKTFHSLLEYLGENDRLSVVAFNNDAISLNPLLRMTAENKAKVLAVIDTLEAKGGTDINRGLSLALSTLSARKYIRVLEDQVFGSNKIKMDM